MVLGCLGALLEISGAIWWRFLAKMGPRWTQDGPSWQQVAPKMGHDSAKMTMLGSVWELLGGSWEHFWSPFSGFGSYVRRCWLQDGVFLAILGDVVASWRQDGAQERQDEAR